MLHKLLTTIAAVLVATGTTTATAADVPEQSQPKGTFSATDVLPVIVRIKRSVEAGLPPPYEIRGERLFKGGGVLAAEEIVFYPDSTLILASQYGEGDESAVQILTRKITILPGGKPPVITWQRTGILSVPPLVGKSSPGRSGGGLGADGAPGSQGTSGNAGYPGMSAPTVYLAVNTVEGGRLYFDLRGQPGGPGGEGQAGGDGGVGQSGEPASSSLFDCKRGPGNGGRGGDGGIGGPGGRGGNGGDGGTLIILSLSSEELPILRNLVEVDFTPGGGGEGGKAGTPGAGGPGGSPGQEA